MSFSIFGPMYFPDRNICPSFKYLYRNGIPVGIVDCSEPEILQNNPDETIEDAFPQSAVVQLDAAQMNVMDEFVRRWESRREDVLRGKPCNTSGKINSILHKSTFGHRNERTLTKQQLNTFLHDSRCYTKDDGLYFGAKHNQKKMKSFHGHSKNIQQPRKQN